MKEERNRCYLENCLILGSKYEKKAVKNLTHEFKLKAKDKQRCCKGKGKFPEWRPHEQVQRAGDVRRHMGQ